MRYYILQIDQEILSLAANTPFAPRIMFNMTSISNGDGMPPASIIKVYNVLGHDKFKPEKIKGKMLMLRAGLFETSLTKKQKIPVSKEDLLFYGTIFAATQSYEGVDSVLTIAVSAIRPPQEVTKQEAQRQVANPNTPVYEQLQKLIEFYVGETYKFEVSEGAMDIVTNQLQTTPFFNPRRGRGGLNNFFYQAGLFNLSIGYNHKDQIVIIQTIDEALKGKPGARTIVLKANEIITQPIWESSEEIVVTICLKPGIELDDWVSLPPDLPIMSSPANIGSVNFLQNSSNSILLQGRYKIKGIQHVGDSRDINAINWATTLKLVSLPSDDPTGDSSLKQY